MSGLLFEINLLDGYFLDLQSLDQNPLVTHNPGWAMRPTLLDFDKKPTPRDPFVHRISGDKYYDRLL